ncbi:MFS multidrug transporter [Colletotrichum musicola]|uniref:MFS multidrug transporter n=1 Tax=Colletotrichum musicola TaxID=2175873 RepID=A0A8H6MKJ3_9PEZI|nr:MFS multidrug transporter [Colletotrichum musicola]
MPLNWPTWQKCINIGLVSILTFIASIASAMCAPGVPDMMAEFHNDNKILSSFIVTIFILGYAVGPVIFAPLSEVYGRAPIYHISNITFTLFSILSAVSPNMAALIIFRFLSGASGAAPLAIGGGTIADLIRPERRGVVVSVYFVGPMLGPAVGPVAAGYIAQSLGWRWIFWVTAIPSGALTLISFVCLRETYSPRLLRKKAAALQEQHPNRRFKTPGQLHAAPVSTLLANALVRPLKLFIFSPIVLVLSTILALAYSYMYVLLTTFTNVFTSEYGFSIGTVGLVYLGLGVGFSTGALLNGLINDRMANKRTKQNRGQRLPEYRLPLMTRSMLLTPVGLFMYGWTAQYHLHWILPIIGSTLLGVGLILIMMPVHTYLIDAFTIYAASAIATTTIFRCVMGTFLPLAGEPLFDSLGLGWGSSLLGFIALALCPVPLLLQRYGEQVRNRFPVAL